MKSSTSPIFSKIPFLGGAVIVTDFADGNFSIRSDGYPTDEYLALTKDLRSLHGGRYKAEARSWNFRAEVRGDVIQAISEWSANHG
jgi:hypothetical protein